MRRHQFLALAVSSFFAVTSAFAAHGGGGHSASHPVSHPASHVSAPHVAAVAHAQPRARREEMRREHDRLGRGVNAAVVYPWWLYGNDYSNPYNDSYSAPYSNAPSMSDNGSDTTAAPDFNAARSTMASIQAQQLAALEASPQWAAANDDLQKASAEVRSATDQLKAMLLARPDYRAAMDQKRAAQERAAMLHDQSNGDDAAIFAAAQDDLNASAAIARIERQAMTTDPAVNEARAHLQAAAAARQALVNGLRSQVINNSDWQAAKGQLEAAH